MDAGDPYPGSSNNTTFNDGTYPSAVDVYGNPTGVAMTDFAYIGGPGGDVTVSLTPLEVVGFTLSYHPWHWMFG